MSGQIDKSKTPPAPNPSGPAGPKDRPVEVFNPNRWLWDFKEEKPQKISRPSGPSRRRSNNEMMMWNLVSSIMDLIFASVICFLFLLMMGRVLDISIKSTLMGLWKLSSTGTVILFFSFLWVYHVALPALVFYTPGQWACHITRTPKEISLNWVLKATFRLLVLFMTGFIILPLFSWASGIDLEENLSGLKLISK